MQKNVAGQKIGAQLISATDSSAFTGSVTVSVTGDAGTQATGSVGSGACTHEGNGYHTYAPAQAETNYDLIAFTFTGTGAVPVTIQVFTKWDANVTQLDGDAIQQAGGYIIPQPAVPSHIVPAFHDIGAITTFAAGSSDNLTVSVTFDSTGSDNIEFFVMHATAGFNSITITDENGGVITQVDEDSNSSVRQIWYRIKKPVTSATHTIRVSCNGGGLPSIAGICMKGAKLADLSAATPILLNTGTGTSVQPGSITPSVDDSLVVTVCGAYAGSITLSGGSGYTSSTEVAQTANHVGIRLAYKAQTTAAAENPTWTLGTTGDRVARNLAIKPELQEAGITIDSYADGRVFQRAPRIADEWWHKQITLSGTYVDEQPAFIEVQGYLTTWNEELEAYNAAIIEIPWTRMTGTTIDDGVWSGQLDVPQRNGWYSFKARGVTAAGVTLGTSLVQECTSGVGIIEADLGQSNMLRRFDEIDTPTDAHPLTRQVYQETWIATSGDGSIAYANAVQAGAECPIALMNYGVAGSGLDYDAGNGKWDDTTPGEPFDVFLDALEFVGGDIELFRFHQGEADCLNPSFSASGYKAAFVRMYERIKVATGRTAATLRSAVNVIGAVNDETYATDARVALVRQTQIEMPQEIEGVFAGASAADLPIDDDYAHFDGPEYVTLGLRDAQCVLFQLGLADYSASGAQALNAWRRSGSANIQIPIEWLSGAGIYDNSTDLTGFEVSNDNFATNLTISSTAIEGRNIVLTLSAAPSGTVKVRYGYGMVPIVTNPAYSTNVPQGDTRRVPLLPRAAMTVETRAALDSTDLAATGTLAIAAGGGLDVGWRLFTSDGLLSVDRTTDGLSVVSDSATETTYSAAVARPSGFESGYFVFDDGLGHEASSLATSAAVDANVISHSTAGKAEINAEVLDVLNVDTFAEIGQETPAATQTLRKMIAYIYKSFRNKKTQTSSQFSLFADDASTVDQKATVSDDGTTTTIGEIATGP